MLRVFLHTRGPSCRNSLCLQTQSDHGDPCFGGHVHGARGGGDDDDLTCRSKVWVIELTLDLIFVCF